MRRRFSQQGFTLIELIVVIAILAVLMLIVILVLNPLKQLNKVEDVQRVHDLSTIATALDGYYNDNNSYPQSISFGQTWSGSNTTYMEKVPQDPQESSNGSYCYLNDGSSNSQWNVLFAKLSNSVSTPQCSLASSCLPQGYTNQWACKVSGKVDCSVLSQQSLPCAIVTPIPTQQPGCTTNGISGVDKIIYGYGQDGSTFEETNVADPYHAGYCKDSRGWDSRVNGNNSCYAYENRPQFGEDVTHYNGAIVSPSAGCSSLDTLYPCSTYGQSCENNACIPNPGSNQYPADITITSPANGTKITINETVYFNIHINKACSSFIWPQLFVNGDISAYCYKTDAADYTCKWVAQPWLFGIPHIHNFTVQAFFVDRSGNDGYAETQLSE